MTPDKGLKFYLGALKALYDPESGDFRTERDADKGADQFYINTHYGRQLSHARNFFVTADSLGYEIPNELREDYFEFYTTVYNDTTRESAEAQLQRYIEEVKKEK